MKNYKPDLRLEDAKHYFAHANSAKCCMNKKQRKKADRVLFKNCQAYLDRELAILDPRIIVTQGQEAKLGIERFTEQSIQIFDQFAQLIQLNGKQVFWLHTYHPNNWGAFNRQRNFDKIKSEATGWVHYAELIQGFVEARLIHR